MMRQYRELKRRFPDYLLLFRLGDFYELFFEDAHAASRAAADHADVAPEGRGGDPDGRHPAPRRRRLHRAPHPRRPEGGGVRADGGARQGQEAGAPRRRARRSRRARSPTPSSSTGPRNNFLLAAHATVRRGRASRWWTSPPATSGSARSRATGDALLEAALLRRPAEILVARERGAPAGWPRWAPRPASPLTPRGRRCVRGRGAAREVLEAHFRGASLDGLGVGDAHRGAARPAGAALAYVRETQGESLGPPHAAAAPRHRRGACCSTRPRWPRSSCSRPPRSGPPAARSSPRSTATAHPDGRPAAPPVAAAARCSTGRRIRRRQEAVAALVDAPAARDGLRRRLAGWGTSSGSPAAPPSAWPTRAT